MRIFRNKTTGKRIELHDKSDSNLIKDLEENVEFQELFLE